MIHEGFQQPESFQQCQIDWDDEFGHRHACLLAKDHDGDHMCAGACGKTLSQWMGRFGDGLTTEDAEEERLRLREELMKQQEHA